MKNFISCIDQYNREMIPVVEEFFATELKGAERVDPSLGQMIKDYQDFLGGGKKLRGCLIALGYEMFGGKNRELALKASLISEIVHTFFLIHDDIMDNDPLRRNKPTMHIKYAHDFGSHFGIAKALNLGDIGVFLAYKLLFGLDTSPEIKNSIAKVMTQVFLEVGLGQTLDITYENKKKFAEDDVLQVHRYKTADYTISAPLAIGALLAGATENVLNTIKDFGIPVGIAFQIRDDELGMFSTEEELGKPVDSDLREGKVTILIVNALNSASEEDRKFLEHAHGNGHLTEKEIERVRQIVTNTGAQEYSHKLARKISNDGKSYIPAIKIGTFYQRMLRELADFVVERKS